MANVRLVITTKRGEAHYSQFQDASDLEMEKLIELCELLGKLNYMKITNEVGDLIYVQGDSIESIIIENSRA